MPDKIDNVWLHHGDVVLERFHFNMVDLAIGTGQFLGGKWKNMGAMHAAIYVGRRRIVESRPEGLYLSAFSDDVSPALRKENPLLKWDVWHLGGHRRVRYAAVDIALDFWSLTKNDHHFGNYKYHSAAFSALTPRLKGSASSDQKVRNYAVKMAESDRRRQFFCSNFVSLVYAMASEEVTGQPRGAIDLNYQRAAPADLAKYFQQPNSGWIKRGQIKQTLFMQGNQWNLE